MELVPLIKSITRAVVAVVFWAILLLSMLLADNIDVQTLLFILVKSILVSAVLWIFLAIILDALIKAMVADAREKKVERMEGGLSYHLTEPSKDEALWQKEHEAELEETEKK
jgi:chromate transport protein ChrA